MGVKDVKRHPEYWGFLNQLADNQRAGSVEMGNRMYEAGSLRANNPFDWHTAGVFGDWLQDHGDARHVILHAATGNDLTTEVPGVLRDEYNTVARQPHPSAVGETYNRDSIHHVADAFQDNAHSGVQLHAQYRYPREAQHPHQILPVLHAVTLIPRTVSTTGKTRSLNLTAPVTTQQLHEFISAMPRSATKAKWVARASKYFGIQPDRPGKPSRKLAAIPPPGQTGGSVLLRVPTPTVVGSSKSAPQPAPEPPAPSTSQKPGMTFLLPQ